MAPAEGRPSCSAEGSGAADGVVAGQQGAEGVVAGKRRRSANAERDLRSCRGRQSKNLTVNSAATIALEIEANQREKPKRMISS